MKTSAKGLAEIAGHEGIILSPYFDSVNILTWGIGHTKAAGSPDPASLPMGVAQPIEAVLSTFKRDMAKYEADVNRAVTVPIEQYQFDALVSFHYNTGAIARASLVKKLNAGDRAGAVAGFDAWHKPPEIIGRRDREKRLFREGIYAHGGKALASPADVKGWVNYRAGTSVDALALLKTTSGPSEAGRPPPDIPAPRQRTTPKPPTAGFLARFWALFH